MNRNYMSDSVHKLKKGSEKKFLVIKPVSRDDVSAKSEETRIQ